MVFIGMVVFWWNAYPLNDVAFMPDEKWNLFLYLLFLCTPIAYFLMSDMLMPKSSEARCMGLLGLLVLLTPLLFSKNEHLHQSIMTLVFLGFLYSMFKYHTHVGEMSGPLKAAY